MHVFARGVEEGVWHAQQAHHPINAAADSWTGWRRLPGGDRLTSSPEVATDSRGVSHLFVRGADASIMHTARPPALDPMDVAASGTAATLAAWSRWATLGDPGRFRSFPC